MKVLVSYHQVMSVSASTMIALSEAVSADEASYFSNPLEYAFAPEFHENDNAAFVNQDRRINENLMS
ncbi:MAG: hypothetical protein AAF423_09700 [Pseudomonadota bacterium]